MSRISDGFIDDLLARTDIVEVVGSRVPLKKQGRDYSARCPFHDERSPSFTVSPTKQFYHCFGCGAHGSAIGFLMQFDRLEFLDAVEDLAKQAGVQVPRDTRQNNANPDTEPLFAVLDAAARFFQARLVDSEKAGDYFDRRGVDAAIRDQFQLGYAPDGYSALRDALGSDQRRLALLEKAGLFSRGERGAYDKFRDRVMFPIHDRRGRVIAFGGRVLDQDDGPKYLNSPETPLFHKGRELYGLWQVRQANRSIARLIVVEGYMDVIALFQHGITQAVATLGTATTPDHAELLFRNAPDVVFCFDGDRAGRNAAWKAVESTLPRMKDGRQAFFLFLPDGEDPDSLVRREGADGFEARLRGAMPLSEFYFNERLQGIGLTSYSGKAALADRCRDDIRRIPDGGFRDTMRARLRELTGVDVLTDTPSAAVAARAALPAPKRSVVRSAITLLLQQPALAADVPHPPAFAALEQAGVELLLRLLQVIRERPDISTGALLEHLADDPAAESLQKLAVIDLPGQPDLWRTEFHDALDKLNDLARQQRREALQARMGSLDEAEKQELRELLQARSSA